MATKKSVTKPLTRRAGDQRVAFIKTVKFGGLGLDESSASLDRAALAAIKDRDGAISAEVDIVQRLVAHDNEGFTVSAKFELSLTEEGSPTAVVKIMAVFSAIFKLTDPAPSDQLEAFAKVEARLIFFPYIRHFVSDMSYRMSIDPIVLPMTSEFNH